jgi:hypothetical protein
MRGLQRNQIMVLAILGVLNVCMLCGFMWVVVSGQLVNATTDLALTAVLQTPAQTPESGTPPATALAGNGAPTATAAASQPGATLASSPTPLPTVTPIPGFKLFRSASAELWAPDTYQGGDVQTLGAKALADKVRAIGPNVAEIADKLEQDLTNPKFVLLAFDPDIRDDAALTFVLVARDPVDADVTTPMNAILDQNVTKLPPDATIVERQILNLERYQEVGVLISEFKITDGAVSIFRRQAMYIIRTPNVYWTLQYYSERNNFKAFRPLMETSLRSFVALQP